MVRLREHQDKDLTNLSVPRVEDFADVAPVVRGFNSFLTLGSSALRITCSALGQVTCEALCRNLGLLSQVDSASYFRCRPGQQDCQNFQRISSFRGKRPFVWLAPDLAPRCEIVGFRCKCSPRGPSNQCRINVLSLNETRFDESVSDNEVYIPGYEIIRVIENMMVGLVGAFVSMLALV